MTFTNHKLVVFCVALGFQASIPGCSTADVALESGRMESQTITSSSKGGDLSATADETPSKESGSGGNTIATPGTLNTWEKGVTEACALLDPAKANKLRIPGGPPLEIDVTKYVKTDGLVRRSEDAKTATFKFSVFTDARGNWMTAWPANTAAHFIHNYEATVAAADTAKCVISARATATPEARTLRGCFDPATMIRMADGRVRKIDDIKQGDLVFNPVTRQSMPVVRVTKGPEAGHGLYEIGFGTGRGAKSVKVTSKHPFMTENGLRMAAQLQKGDRILTARGTFRKIDVVNALAPKAGQMVVNIALGSESFAATDHMVLADGIVTGDLQLQERLENTAAISMRGASSSKGK